MSIKFICTCGKHLKARDEMAARRSVCPRCGQVVGIPTNKPTQRGTAAEVLSPSERVRRKVVVPVSHEAIASAQATSETPVLQGSLLSSPETSAIRQLYETDQVRLVKKQKKLHVWRYVWPLERRWYHALWFPVFAWWLVLGVTAIFSFLTGGVAMLLPLLDDIRAEQPGSLVFAFAVAVPLAAYACASLHCVLVAAMGGDSGRVRWPAHDFRFVVQSLGRWLLAFLAGPVILVTTAFFFWFSAGDLKAIDWIIMGELVFFAGAWWLFAVASIAEAEGASGAHPTRVALLMQRLGWWTLGMASAVFLTVSGIIAFLVPVLTELSRDTAFGWLLLTGVWLVGLYFVTFLLRLLGLLCFWRRVQGCEPDVVNRAV